MDFALLCASYSFMGKVNIFSNFKNSGAGPRRLGHGSLGYRSLGQGSLLT